MQVIKVYPTKLFLINRCSNIFILVCAFVLALVLMFSQQLSSKNDQLEHDTSKSTAIIENSNHASAPSNYTELRTELIKLRLHNSLRPVRHQSSFTTKDEFSVRKTAVKAAEKSHYDFVW